MSIWLYLWPLSPLNRDLDWIEIILLLLVIIIIIIIILLYIWYDLQLYETYFLNPIQSIENWLSRAKLAVTELLLEAASIIRFFVFGFAFGVWEQQGVGDAVMKAEFCGMKAFLTLLESIWFGLFIVGVGKFKGWDQGKRIGTIKIESLLFFKKN